MSDSIFDRDIPAAEKSFVPALTELVGASEVIRFSKSVSGFVPVGHMTNVGKAFAPSPHYLFGLRAGPSLSVSFALHELAHLVEIDDRRATMFGWGLDVPTQWVYDRLCAEPVTNQATTRECRVVAYQALLGDAIGLKADIRDTVSALQYMPDWWHVPGRSDKARIAWCERQVRKNLQTMTVRQTLDELRRKIQILERRAPQLLRAAEQAQ